MPKIEELSLAEVAAEFGKQDAAIKKATPLKDEAKKAMFARFDEVVEPEEMLMEVLADNEDDARREAIKRYPAFTIDDIRKDGPRWEVILIERRDLKKYTFVNALDGKVYGRKQVSGKTYLDEVALQAENMPLWRRISAVPNAAELTRLLELATDGPLDDDWLDFFYEGEREFIGLDKIDDPEDLAEVQYYLYETVPTVSVAAPRDAKPEELEGLDG